jgi:hypothetical protein
LLEVGLKPVEIICLVVKVAINSPEHVTKRKKATDRAEESLLKSHLLAGKAVPYHTHDHDRGDE